MYGHKRYQHRFLIGIGPCKSIKITLETGTLTVPSTEMRKKIGWDRLPDTPDNPLIEEQQLEKDFEGRGYGHGVGMCQWSCLQMAKEGLTYKQILNYFYPGTTIQLYENR